MDIIKTEKWKELKGILNDLYKNKKKIYENKSTLKNSNKQKYINNNKEKKGVGLYKTFEIYNNELKNLIKNYNKLKDSLKGWNYIIKKIDEYDISYEYKDISGIIKYFFKGKLRTDHFDFYFKKWKRDKKYYNIFLLENLILKEAFSKLNRHGLAFKYIYDIIYRKIFKYPYIITIKPKTIIISSYKDIMKYIFEWKYNKDSSILENLQNKEIKKWIHISILKRYTIFNRLNFFNYKILNNYLIFKKEKLSKMNLLIKKNYRIFLIIKNLYIKWEFKNLIKMKKRIINLDDYLEEISYELLDEECEELYINYLKEIKENNKIILIKEKLFKSIIKKNINHWKINLLYEKKLNIKEENKNKWIINELNFLDFTKKFIKKKNKNKFSLNYKRNQKNKFFEKERRIKLYNDKFKIKKIFVYKLYFLYFFWSLFLFNKIFFNFNKIFFNLWNRFYYLFQNSYNIRSNNIFFSYLILYRNNKIFNHKEFENRWKNYIDFVKKNIKYEKEYINIKYKIWKKIYLNVFLLNNENIKNIIYKIYNNYLSNFNIYKNYKNNTIIYEKINKIFNIIDNNWENNYNIYYNYNYLSLWKTYSIKSFELNNKFVQNKLLFVYKKIDNFLEYINYNDKLLTNNNLIDPKIKNDIYQENIIKRNKKKIWYK